MEKKNELIHRAIHNREPLEHKHGTRVTKKVQTIIEEKLAEGTFLNASQYIRYCILFSQAYDNLVEDFEKEVKAKEKYIETLEGEKSELQKSFDKAAVNIDNYANTIVPELQKDRDEYKDSFKKALENPFVILKNPNVAIRAIYSIEDREELQKVLDFMSDRDISAAQYVKMAIHKHAHSLNAYDRLLAEKELVEKKIEVIKEDPFEILNDENIEKFIDKACNSNNDTLEYISEYLNEYEQTKLTYLKHSVMQYAYIVRKNERLNEEIKDLRIKHRKEIDWLKKPFYKKWWAKIKGNK